MGAWGTLRAVVNRTCTQAKREPVLWLGALLTVEARRRRLLKELSELFYGFSLLYRVGDSVGRVSRESLRVWILDAAAPDKFQNRGIQRGS